MLNIARIHYKPPRQGRRLWVVTVTSTEGVIATAKGKTAAEAEIEAKEGVRLKTDLLRFTEKADDK